MNYRMRRGVVLTTICDEYVLVSSKDAQTYCPFISTINETAAFIIRCLMEDMSIAETASAFGNEYEVDSETDALKVVSTYVSQLKELGYLEREGV